MGELMGSSPPAGAYTQRDKGQAGLRLQEIKPDATLTSRAYEALRQAIAEMPIYDGLENCRLDERALANDLGTSRTPVREALLRLENEGVVQTIPRRGVYVIRKTKTEIIEVIFASAALESMAARLAAERASDAEIQALRAHFPLFSEDIDAAITIQRPGQEDPADNTRRSVPLDEYSVLNINFHQRIVDLAHSELFSQHVSRLQIHMRAIRHRTIGDTDRVARSIVDHAHILDALENRDPELAEVHVRQHALDLAEHVRIHMDYLK